MRVYVTLTSQTPGQRLWTWPVAAVVIREDHSFVIDDVIYIDNHIYDREADQRHQLESSRTLFQQGTAPQI